MCDLCTNFYPSTGILRYSSDEGYRLAVECDKELADYYRSFIPKSFQFKKPRWPPHITVVRAEKETPVNLEPWARYQGEEVEFLYSNIVHFGTVYVWLNCFCKRLEEIRAELGLSIRSQYTIPPDGYSKAFHLTIGNQK